MNEGGFQPLTSDDVRHVAKLARLRLSDAEIERYRHDLSSVLQYVAMLQEVDVSNVEPMAHPLDLHSRMDRDEPTPPLPRETLARIAPVLEGPYIVVPRVLDEGAAGGGGA